jgi:hypothetical protein
VKPSTLVKGLNNNSPFLIIAVAALILTGLIGYVSIRIEETYRQNYPYRSLDPVYYMYYNAKLSVRLLDETRLNVAVDEWISNDRFPLRTVPLILFAPELLARPYGYMATSLPMFTIMLWMMGVTVYRRTRHILYSLAVISLLGATSYLFNLEYGFATYWLDTPMSYLFGAAVLSLVNSRGKSIPWLVAFAVLASFTVLSRYIAVMYILFISAPLLVYYLARRWRVERNFWKAVALPVGIIAVIILSLAGVFLFRHFSNVLGFYTSYGYALGFGIQESLIWVLSNFVTMVSSKWFWLLMSIAGVNLFLIFRSQIRDWENLIISLWLATGVLILFGVIIRTGSGVHVLPTAVPLLVLALCAPVQFREPWKHYTYLGMTVVACLIIISTVNLAGRSIDQAYTTALNPTPIDQDDKQFENALARILQSENRPLVWNVYFAEFAWKPTMVSFLRSKILPLPAGQPFYNEHLTAWEADYPDLDPYEVADRIHIASTKWVDLAVVLSDPQQAVNAEWLANDYSRIVAAEMSTRLAQDDNWEKITEISSQQYGLVVLYRNLNSNGAAYEEVFHGRLRP